MIDKVTTEAYLSLAKHLDSAPLGAPETPELMAILERLFSPQEAAVAARLPFKPVRADRLASDLGLEIEALGPMLEAMADRGLVYQRRTKGGDYYSLLPVMPGMVELQFMAGRSGPEQKELARLFEDYYEPGLGPAMTRTAVPYPRVIPVGRTVEHHQEILPFERAEDVINGQELIALANCYCRHEAELLDQGCGAPKDVCMIFGPFARFAAEKGFARLVDKKEALDALLRAEEAGLVHVTDNVAEGANFMCNCCGCCCMFLRTVTQLDHPGAVAQAAFRPEVDRAACTECGACAETCQVEAVHFDDAPPWIDEDRCLGCGQCARACAFGAIEMTRRDRPQPLPDWPSLVKGLRAKN